MALDREALFVALTDRITTATEGTVRLVTRRFEGWDTTPPPLQPAIAVIKGPERPDHKAANVGAVWTLVAYLLVYARDDGSGDAVIDPLFNRILTAIEEALEMQPGEIPASTSRPYYPALGAAPGPTTLGGLCLSCQIVGEVEVYQGVTSHQGFLKLQVEIVATA